MTDRIAPLGCQPPPIEDHLRDASGARPDATTAPRSTEADHTDHVVHGGLEGGHAALFTAEVFHVGGAAGGAAATIAGPFLALAGYGLLINHAYEEGDRRNLEHNDQMLRGALAAFEGRADDPAVVAERRQNPGYDQGIRMVERFARTHPREFQQVHRAVVASNRGGQLAVAQGHDEGPEFERRYDADPAFRHGVGYMRRLRDRDPEAFERKAAHLERMAAEVDRARCSNLRM